MKVLEQGFEYEGRIYGSLTAVVRPMGKGAPVDVPDMTPMAGPHEADRHDRVLLAVVVPETVTIQVVQMHQATGPVSSGRY